MIITIIIMIIIIIMIDGIGLEIQELKEERNR